MASILKELLTTFVLSQHPPGLEGQLQMPIFPDAPLRNITPPGTADEPFHGNEFFQQDKVFEGQTDTDAGDRFSRIRIPASFSKPDVESVIRDRFAEAGFPSVVRDVAVAQAFRESSLNPKSHNKKEDARGLFQIREALASDLKVDFDSLFEVEANIEAIIKALDLRAPGLRKASSSGVATKLFLEALRPPDRRTKAFEGLMEIGVDPFEENQGGLQKLLKQSVGNEKQFEPFDPEGSGFDIETAKKFGLQPEIDPEDGLPHMQSRVPLSVEEAKKFGIDPELEAGLLLKGRQHPTFHKAIEADKALGFRLLEQGGRLFTVRPRGQQFNGLE